jgi:HEAT repeat protein
MDPSALAEHTDEFDEALQHGYNRRLVQKALGKFPLSSIAAHAATLRGMSVDPPMWASDRLVVQAMAAELLARLPGTAPVDGLATLPAEPTVQAEQPQASSEPQASAQATPTATAIKLRLQGKGSATERAMAIEALKRLGLSALEEHMRLLLHMALSDSNDHVRECAMRAVDQLPAAALAQEVPALLALFEKGPDHVATRAAEVLQKVDGAVLAAYAMGLLTRVLDPARKPHVRRAAAKDLELLPPSAVAPHLGRLLSMLSTADRKHGEYSLDWAINPVLRGVVAAMPANDVAKVLTVDCAGLDQARVRQTALDSVISHLPAERLGPHAPLLMSLLLDPDAGVRESALRTLWKLDPSDLARQHPALLLLGLLDQVPAVRCAAMWLLPLDRLAHHAAEVLRMLWDSDASVRETALQVTEGMIEKLQVPALKEQLRLAAIKACTGGGVLGTLQGLSAREAQG